MAPKVRSYISLMFNYKSMTKCFLIDYNYARALNFDYATILTPVRYPDNYIGRLSVLFVIYYMRLSFTWRATFAWNRKPAQETWRLIPFFHALGGAEGGAEQGGAELGEGGGGGWKSRSFQDHFCLYFATRAFQRKRYRFLHTASVVSLNPQKDKNIWNPSCL